MPEPMQGKQKMSMWHIIFIERARIALPRLSQEKRWMQVMNTADHIGQTFEPVALEEQGHVEVAPQSISILISCAEQGKEYNESVRAL